jgi:hypothetical protein
MVLMMKGCRQIACRFVAALARIDIRPAVCASLQAI